MKIRIISAAVGVPLILLTFAFHSVFPLCINILCAFASLCCAIELINAKKWIKDLKLSVPCMLFASLLPMSVTVRMFLTVLVFFILYIFMLLVTRHGEYDFSDISYICTAIGLSAFGISCVVFVSLKDEAKSCFYITLCLAIAWISDAGAYFVGSFLGKKKLCPEISPKKTVEGAVGGVIIGVAGALADALVFQYVILGETVKIPNSQLTNNSVVNRKGSDYKALVVNVNISYKADVEKAKKVLTDIISEEPNVSKDNISVFVDELGESCIKMGAFMMVPVSEYLSIKRHVNEAIIIAFRQEGLEIPYNQLDVHVINTNK